MYYSDFETRKLKNGLRLFNSLIMDTETDHPKEIAGIYRELFNAVYGVMPEQARFIINRLFGS